MPWNGIRWCSQALIERDVADHDHLVVVGLERDGQVLGRVLVEPREDLLVHRARRAPACARSPSRSGSSPIASRISRTAASMRGLSTALPAPSPGTACRGFGSVTGSFLPFGGWPGVPGQMQCGRSSRRRTARVLPAGSSWVQGSTSPRTSSDLVGLERLVLDQRGGEAVERRPVLGQDRPGHVVGAVDAGRAPRRRCWPRSPRSSPGSTRSRGRGTPRPAAGRSASARAARSCRTR